MMDKPDIKLGTIIDPNTFLSRAKHICTIGTDEFYRFNNLVVKYNTETQELTGRVMKG